MGDKVIRGDNTDETLADMVGKLSTILSALRRARPAMRKKRLKLVKAEHTVGAWQAIEKLGQYTEALRQEIRSAKPGPPE